MGCAAQADGNFSSFVWRCTRRSECRRAEEKNGWLWSPKQQCVKIVSFSPSNLSCRKTGKVQLCLFLTHTVSDFLCSLLLSPFSLQYLTPLTCRDWVINWVHCESETSSSRSSSSVLIHPENSKLSYYNLRGWLSEDGEPLPIPPFLLLLCSCLSDSHMNFHQQHVTPFSFSVSFFEKRIRFFIITLVTQRYKFSEILRAQKPQCFQSVCFCLSRWTSIFPPFLPLDTLTICNARLSLSRVTASCQTLVRSPVISPSLGLYRKHLRAKVWSL